MTDQELKEKLKHENKLSILRVCLRYFIFLIVSGFTVFYLLHFNPLDFDNMDAILLKQNIFVRTPEWIFKVIELFIILIILSVSKKLTIKAERKKIEMYAPTEYRKIYLEKELEIKKLKNKNEYTVLENIRLEKENKKYSNRLNNINDSFRIKG